MLARLSLEIPQSQNQSPPSHLLSFLPSPTLFATRFCPNVNAHLPLCRLLPCRWQTPLSVMQGSIRFSHTFPHTPHAVGVVGIKYRSLALPSFSSLTHILILSTPPHTDVQMADPSVDVGAVGIKCRPIAPLLSYLSSPHLPTLVCADGGPICWRGGHQVPPRCLPQQLRRPPGPGHGQEGLRGSTRGGWQYNTGQRCTGCCARPGCAIRPPSQGRYKGGQGCTGCCARLGRCPLILSRFSKDASRLP